MTTILAIAGSVRAKSFNAMLLATAVELAPAGITVETASIKDIPLYDGDAEATSGIPPAVQALKERIVQASGVLLVTPEYNNSLPGVFKNAIDWLSRPALASVLRWKPVAIVGASSGRGGTRRAQQQVRDALLFPGAVVLDEPQVALPIAWERFDPDLNLTDENAGAALTELLTGLVALTHEHHHVAA